MPFILIWRLFINVSWGFKVNKWRAEHHKLKRLTKSATLMQNSFARLRTLEIFIDIVILSIAVLVSILVIIGIATLNIQTMMVNLHLFIIFIRVGVHPHF